MEYNYKTKCWNDIKNSTIKIDFAFISIPWCDNNNLTISVLSFSAAITNAVFS